MPWNLHLLIMAALAAGSVPASAQSSNIKLGQLALHPYYKVSGTYDDNIYLVPPNKNGHAVAGGGIRGSWILTNSLGLGLELPIGERHKFSGAYDFTAVNYKAQPRANNATNHKADAGYDFKGAKTRASLSEAYMNTQDPQFNPNSVTVAGELVRRERRWQNVAGVAGEYALGDKFYLGADGQDTVHKYLSPNLGAFLNRYEVLFGLKAAYKVQPKTRVYLATHRQLVHYSAGRQANHKDWLFDLGIEGQLSPKVKGMAQAGLQYRLYDKDEANPDQRRISRNMQTNVRLNYVPAERWEFNLNVLRNLNESASNTTGGQFYITSGVALDGSHAWRKLTFGANAGLQVDKYKEAVTVGGITHNRRDDLYSAGARVEYKIQEWLLAEASYKHLRRHSIFTEQFNYKDNRSSVGLKFTF